LGGGGHQHFYVCSTACFGFLTESRKEKKIFMVAVLLWPTAEVRTTKLLHFFTLLFLHDLHEHM
jgi:hypothetical protein